MVENLIGKQWKGNKYTIKVIKHEMPKNLMAHDEFFPYEMIYFKNNDKNGTKHYLQDNEKLIIEYVGEFEKIGVDEWLEKRNDENKRFFDNLMKSIGK